MFISFHSALDYLFSRRPSCIHSSNCLISQGCYLFIESTPLSNVYLSHLESVKRYTSERYTSLENFTEVLSRIVNKWINTRVASSLLNQQKSFIYRSNGLPPLLISIILPPVSLPFPVKQRLLFWKFGKKTSVCPPTSPYSQPNEEEGIILPVRSREGPNYQAINSFQSLSMPPHG